MQGGLLLDVVIGYGASFFELLAGENKTLLIRWDTLLVLNLRLDVVDGVGGLNNQRDGFPSQSLNENLHPNTEPENLRKGASIIELRAGKK